VGHSAGLRGGVGSTFSQEQYYSSNAVDDSRKVAICGPREIHMIEGHMRTERGMRVACWSGFSL
jgi:hypothetical protein